MGLAFAAILGATTQVMIRQWRVDLNTDFPTHQEPLAGWQTYRNEEYGFEFKYPNFLQQEQISTNRVFFSFEIGGSINIEIRAEKFNPENIRDYVANSPEMVLIKNTTAVKLNNKNWYSYESGEEGCGGPIYHTALKENTLIVSFFGCEGRDLYNITDSVFIEKVLSTFKFIESVK